MNSGYREFDQRLRSLDKKKAAIKEGAKAEMDDTGLVELKPHGQMRRAFFRMLPIRALMILAVIGVGYKSFLLISLGSANYAEKVSLLNASGRAVDQIGGWLMQVDPVTLKIAEVISPLIG